MISGGPRLDYAGKRLFDLISAAPALVLALPLILPVLLVVWIADRHNPLYVSERIGRGGQPFRFIKVRTMIPRPSASSVDTTIASDPRITTIGRYVRACKLDELPQLLHVVSGRMSMVGPRPNVAREVALYTEEERSLLSVPPGITDIASIVFADLASTLADAADPDIAYNQLVRPWKSRLGLHYVRVQSLRVDVEIMLCTLSLWISRRWTLRRISRLLGRTGAPAELARFALREEPLKPMPPPGANAIVTSRAVR